MVDILLLQTISIAIASAGILIAAIYYVLQIRHQRKMRQTDLLLKIYSTFGCEEFQKALAKTFNLDFKDYDEFVKKYYNTSTGFVESPEIISMSMVNVLFEEVGVLLNRKLIDIGLVDDLFGYMAVPLWEKIKPAVEGLRQQFQSPRSLQKFEYLHDRLKEREQRGAKNG
jgi:hypothetical protein